MYENMDQDDAVETTKKSKVKTVQLEIFKEKIEDLQKRFENKIYLIKAFSMSRNF